MEVNAFCIDYCPQPRTEPTKALSLFNDIKFSSEEEIIHATQKVLKLSKRQKKVLSHIVMGLSNKEIATELCIQEGTVKMHCADIFKQLGVKNRTRAALMGYLVIQHIKKVAE